jgi:DNA primase
VGRFVPDSAIDRIRQAVDIVSLVRESVPLIKAGANFKACCPFHQEKTPSFTVNPDRQSFKCFGCGEGGDLFSFVMKTENVSFPEALQILADRAHIELPKYEGEDSGPSRDEKAMLYRVTRWAAAMFHRWLVEDAVGAPALKYLTDRGITTETIKTFQLGFAPDGWSNLLDAAEAKSIPIEAMHTAGLLSTSERSEKGYDRFRSRVIFPISDARDRAIGFGARAMDDSEPKYLNSPETPLFSKGRTLYGLNTTRGALTEMRQAIVVEGYMDAIMAHQHGVPNVVGVLGTALTRDHVRLLRRYVDEAVVLFDADNAGINSANRSIDAFAAEELTARVVTLPDGLDPDDFLRQHGVEAFREVLSHGNDGIDFKLTHALEHVPENLRTSPLAVAKALDDVLATVAMIPNSVAQSLELRKISERTGVPESDLHRRLKRLTSGRRRREEPEGQDTSAPLGRDAEAELLEAMLTYPSTVSYVQSRLEPEALENQDIRELVALLFQMKQEGAAVSPEGLLMRIQQDRLRAVVERIIGKAHAVVGEPEQWCRELITGLKSRVHAAQTAAINAKVRQTSPSDRSAADALLAEKMQAAREAQRNRGSLELNK